MLWLRTSITGPQPLQKAAAAQRFSDFSNLSDRAA